MTEGLSRVLSQDGPVCNDAKECYLDTIMGNLVRKQKRAQQELDNTTAAINALKANPELANVLELISKAGR